MFSADSLSLSVWLVPAEAATRGVLKEKLFLEISQNSQEKTCATVICARASVARHVTKVPKIESW